MNPAHRTFILPAAILFGLVAAPALAQRPLNPEERIMFIEQQLRANQTAAIRLDQRLGAIERQLQQLINQGEISGHRVGVLEAEIGKLRTEVDSRMAAVETRPVAESNDASSDETVAVKPKLATASSPSLVRATVPAPTESSGSDPGEDAYSEGFRLWRDGNYDQAITALRAFTSAFPNHRRVSFANNLIGRALLDDGKPRPAAEALLANYRANPKGERAPDSLYYLGQALVKLNQSSQACKAYSELESVYGSSIRNDLRSQLSDAKAEASCS